VWGSADLRASLQTAQQQIIPRYGCYNRALDPPLSSPYRLYRWDEIALEKITEMVSRKFVSGARETMAQIYLKRGAIVPQHTHESEQMTYVLQGALKLLVAGEEVTLREGEVLHIPSNVAHQVEALDDTFVLGVFSPVRQDWNPPESPD
jgi:quercetin dioxygenase-like cupin family protein